MTESEASVASGSGDITTTTTTAEMSICERCKESVTDMCRMLFGFLAYVVAAIFLAGLMLVGFVWLFVSLLILGVGVLIYYCTTKDPLPLAEILGFTGSSDTEHSPVEMPCREDLESRLIVRKVIKVEHLDQEKKGEESCCKLNHPQKQDGPIHIATDRICLHFSGRIVYEGNKDGSHSEGPQENFHSLEPSHTANDEEEAVVSSFRGDASNDPSPRGTSTTSIASGGPTDLSLTGTDIATRHTGSITTRDGEVDGGGSETTEDIENQENILAGDVSALPLEAGTSVPTAPEVALPTTQELDPDDDRGITSCDICFLDYELGDEVAWSPNNACLHAYHKACILDWLERKPTCPICRHEYLHCSEDPEV